MWILSKLSVNRANPSKVFVDPFQVVLIDPPPPGSTLSEVILPKSLQILSKLSVDQPPRINIVRGDPSKVFADPFQVECQLTPPQINIVRGNPSKVFVDPFQVECRSTPPHLIKMTTSKLSVN